MGDCVTVWGLVLSVHILAMAAWTGGMAYALLVVRPSLGALPASEQLAVHGLTLKRFFLVVWHAMPLVLITGWAMVFGVYGGFAGLNWAVNGMQALGLVMAVVFLVMFFGPWRRFRTAPSADGLAAVRRLVSVNLGLALVVTVLASLAQWSG